MSASRSPNRRSRREAPTRSWRRRRSPRAATCSRSTPTTSIPSPPCARSRSSRGPGLPVFERETLLAKSNFTRERVDAFAVLDVGPDGFLRGIVEKAPGAAGSRGRVLLSMNLWRFSPSIFEACRRVPVSARGERELPQAVAWSIVHQGERFRAVPCAEGVLDLSTRADVADVERRLAGVEPRP